MTQQQQNELRKAKNKIGEIREILDNVMYRMMPTISDDDYDKIREVYDLLCVANDKLS